MPPNPPSKDLPMNKTSRSGSKGPELKDAMRSLQLPWPRPTPKNPKGQQYSVQPIPPHGRSVRPGALSLTAFAVFAFSAYGSYLLVSYRRAIENSRALAVPLDVSDRYHKTAQSYDAEVDMAERIMRLGTRRKELIREARGDVLEVSCGTGRNMDFYLLGETRGVGKNGKAEIKGCRSVTFVDQSAEMIEIARSKFEKKFPAFKRVYFRTQDAMDPIPPRPQNPLEGAKTIPTATMGFPNAKSYQYDTVVQTMGLCSHPDPVSFLTHLGTLAKPENGQILLLEHGRSYYSWVNKILDDLAPAHADRHGCWWNRDIGEVVRQSGLEVVEAKRWHLGTTWRFVLRPKRVQE